MPVSLFTVCIRYLIQLLNLHPANPDNIPATVPLHALENALSRVVATMFWTCKIQSVLHATPDCCSVGHIPPTHGPVTWGYHNRTMVSVLLEATNSTFFLKGNATITEMVTQIHLEVRGSIPKPVDSSLTISPKINIIAVHSHDFLLVKLG
jgi:hypothetical protein